MRPQNNNHTLSSHGGSSKKLRIKSTEHITHIFGHPEHPFPFSPCNSLYCMHAASKSCFPTAVSIAEILSPELALQLAS